MLFALVTSSIRSIKLAFNLDGSNLRLKNVEFERMATVRTRMAPSPTGEYHIGHIRTLLFNWAFAKKHKGKFIIRIEDTDRERLVEGAVARILDVIEAYGLSWDEGPRVGGPYAPYIQSERLNIYQKYVKKLIENDSAYYCFCSQERLEKMREKQKKMGFASPKYDRFCLKLSKTEINKRLEAKEPHVVRLKVPDDSKIVFNDLILGEIAIHSSEVDDQVLIKSDGFPTYHFAVVVDDHLMKISHVMRGNDWVSSTPKHILLYQAFGWQPPKFAHLPNLKEVGAGKKLSKRFGAVAAADFLKQGYLSEAVINFLMLLGWNPGHDKEIMSLEEFVDKFAIEDIQKTDLVAFDRQKLTWMNGEYIRRTADDKLTSRIFDFFEHKYPKSKIAKIVPLIKTRINTLAEFETIAGFFFDGPQVDKKLFGKEFKAHLQTAVKALESVDRWSLENINTALMATIEKSGFKTSKFFMDLRIAITGSEFTPPINESIEILGRQEILKRLSAVLA